MIDVLAFPPNESALDTMRRARLDRCHDIERRGRLALFISVAIFLTWVADVAAVFEHPSGHLPAAFGVASFALALVIVASHSAGRLLLARAQKVRSSTEWGFAAVRIHQAQELVAFAENDAVVAQYLRMVGRQQRALRCMELAALTRWASRETGPKSRDVSGSALSEH